MHLLVLIFAIVFVISILIRFCLPFRYGSIQFSKFKVYRSRSTLFYLKWLVAYFLVKFGKRKPAPASPEHIERPQKQLDQPYVREYIQKPIKLKNIWIFCSRLMLSISIHPLLISIWWCSQQQCVATVW